MENQSTPQTFPSPHNIDIRNLYGLFPTVTSVPTHIPRKFDEQFRIYVSGSTYRFYWYDVTNATWRYSAAFPISESDITLSDVTIDNASTSAHGFLKKLDNDATHFMDGTGNWDSVKDSDLSTSDITTNDVSTSKHGFAPKAPNDTTKFLRGDATWATPTATASASIKFATMFETAGRFSTNHASGTATFGTSGVSLDTTSTGSRRAHIYSSATVPGAAFAAYAGSPAFAASVYLQTIGTTGHFAAGIGDMSGGPSTTTNHAGFFIQTASGTTNLFASNANGTTQTKSSSLTTFAAGDMVDLYLKFNGTSSIDFYWRKNNGSWSSATNQSTNIPTGNESIYMGVLAANTTGQFVAIFQSSTYER